MNYLDLTLIEIHKALVDKKIKVSDLVKEVVREIEKSKPKFIISRPHNQKLFTKIYILIKSLIV